MPWSSWYNTLLPTLAGATNADVGKLDDSRKRLEVLMRKNVPTGVGNEAKAFAAELRAWEKKVAGLNLNEAQIKGLMKAIARQPDTITSGWDGGAQVYLGLAALHHGLTDLDPPLPKPSPYLGDLLQMRKGLADAYPTRSKERSRYDIPSNYRPEPLAERLQSILKSLESKNANGK